MAKDSSKKVKWSDGLKAEFRKIIWPTRQDVEKETGAVLVVSIILGAIIALIDFLAQHGIDFLISL
jgi:preprotein translocase subunit SecE